jgi:hypothetical protein
MRRSRSVLAAYLRESQDFTPTGTSCGLGGEIVLLLGALGWWRRRR